MSRMWRRLGDYIESLFKDLLRGKVSAREYVSIVLSLGRDE